uniref:Uncharacterized protein n=1 Tax=Rubinisphaera brasiliensis (strain ATCC 49424 / DSM 5305 / JCM 21570 / IAM 15109 / NBRC 103401 / IFAM 1448) TaxID=756272 RepID=F0SGK6_RUBBR|nr:hypothetical protein Plabr_4034 [Rubinisphaera brasiliensis DSM 5305]
MMGKRYCKLAASFIPPLIALMSAELFRIVVL